MKLHLTNELLQIISTVHFQGVVRVPYGGYIVKKLLSSLALIGTMAPLASMAEAGPEDKPVLEEITVTGIRKSIEDSIKIKRDLDIVSGTISPGDVGQFPDGNLA